MAKDKKQIKQDMGKHAKPEDRFTAFANGVLDQAAELVSRGLSTEEQLAAIEGMRAQLGEAWADINAKGGKK